MERVRKRGPEESSCRPLSRHRRDSATHSVMAFKPTPKETCELIDTELNTRTALRSPSLTDNGQSRECARSASPYVFRLAELGHPELGSLGSWLNDASRCS